jgi:hypothetical protein
MNEGMHVFVLAKLRATIGLAAVLLVASAAAQAVFGTNPIVVGLTLANSAALALLTFGRVR